MISPAANSAARVVSPAARACRTAGSIDPAASHQAEARACSTGTMSCSWIASSSRSAVRRSRWRRYQEPLGVDGDDEEVRPRDRLQYAVRAVGAEHGVAQRTRHDVQDRNAAEEADDVGMQLGQHFVPDELGGDVDRGRRSDREHQASRLGSVSAQRERREVHPSRPPLRRGHDLCHVVGPHGPGDDLQQARQFVGAEREVAGAELEELFARTTT